MTKTMPSSLTTPAHGGNAVSSDEKAALPEIIVIANGIDPHGGSEPGKGWWWSKALSQHFKIHIITSDISAGLAANTQNAIEGGWVFHPIKERITTWKYGIGYFQYWQWLQLAMRKAREIKAQHPIVGLCHVVMGSFRVLGAYDQLGLPYVLGPFGGGEYAPKAFLQGRKLPWAHWLIERLRPHINDAFAFVPSLRQCMKGATLVMATSEEGCHVVRKMGARKAVAVFPDSYDYPVDIGRILAHRQTQLPEISKEIRLLWQGRPLWWKTPDLALRLLRRALDRGVRARLVMVTQWSDPVGRTLKKMAGDLGLEGSIDFVEPMPRARFLEMALGQHVFLATSLHDSGGIPLIEAQAQGLPCFTLALGGNRAAACPEAGISSGVETPEAFFEASVNRLLQWQGEPQGWLAEAEKALHFSTRFSQQRLEEYVEGLIVPAFTKNRRS